MAKKFLIGIFCATAVVLVLVIVIGTHLENAPVIQGKVTLRDGDRVIHPLTNVLERRGGGKVESFPPLDLAALGTLPELPMQGNFVIDYSAPTLESFQFSLYDQEGRELYGGRRGYTAPTAPGRYTVRLCFAWGKDNNKQIYTENYFCVLYA